MRTCQAPRFQPVEIGTTSMVLVHCASPAHYRDVIGRWLCAECASEDREVLRPLMWPVQTSLRGRTA